MATFVSHGSENRLGRPSDWIQRENLKVLLPIAATYFVLAKLALGFAFLQANASPIWPPTGLAIALVWILGPRVLPGIFLGSMLASMTVGPLKAAPLIALGNTLEAWAAVTLVRPQVREQLFSTLRATVTYILGGSLLAPVISASMGVGSLMLCGAFPLSAAGSVWLTWWTGNVVGALVVGPLLIGAHHQWGKLGSLWQPRQLPVMLGAIYCTGAIFCQWAGLSLSGLPVAFLLIPVFVVVATRLCLPCAMLCLLLCSAVAVTGTLLGNGPFSLQPPNTALALLQAFIGISSATMLIMHSIMAERDSNLHSLQQTAGALARNIVSLQLANRDKEQALRQLMQSEKLAALGGLVAGIAHELNTPLGNSLTLSSTISDAVDHATHSLKAGTLSKAELSLTLENLAEASALLQKNCVKGSELISQFKQVAVDQTSMRRREFDLRQTIDDIMAALRPQLKRRPINVTLGVPQGIMLDSYPGALDQILTNLVHNSLLHAFADEEGGEISLLSEEEADAVTLVYRDNGKGIPVDFQEKVFDPFFTTRLGQGGSGLGLYLVYNMVTGPLGGTIRLESAAGQGCRFLIRLPLHAPVREEAGATRQSYRE